jgi:oligopeptide/dipeptide ABC transporter ATP-binding protein
MIFQEPMTSLNPLLTVGYQIAEVIRAHGRVSTSQAQRDALELLDMVKIPNAKERLGEYPLQLSGGMRQRVVIAMALACHPVLLIADEPTTALDVTTQAHILDTVRDLQRAMNMSVLFITHDLSLVAENADRALVMYYGSIVEETDVDSLFYSPGHPYTVGLLHSMPATAVWHGFSGDLPIIPGNVPSPTQRPNGCAFAPRCAHSVPECENIRPVMKKCRDSFGMLACHRADALGSSIYETLPWIKEKIAMLGETV